MATHKYQILCGFLWEGFADEMSYTVNCCCVFCLMQWQLFMIPRWTSETMKPQTCSEFLMGGNIMQIYMWGINKCFATCHFLSTGVIIIYRRDLTSPLPCRRIPLELIPEDEAECAAWLHKLYQEKVQVCWRWTFSLRLFSLYLIILIWLILRILNFPSLKHYTRVLHVWLLLLSRDIGSNIAFKEQTKSCLRTLVLSCVCINVSTG